MSILSELVAWLNVAANALGRLLLAPIAFLPGWISATVIAAITGVLMLLIFKHTSNQAAIKRVRARIDANLLAIRLFRESTAVTFGAQAKILAAALKLAALALVPMLVMTVPVLLLLGQISLWYQQRPLRVGEEAVLTIKLNDSDGPSLEDVKLLPNDGVRVLAGPVRIPSKNEVVWNLAAEANAPPEIQFEVGSAKVAKQLSVGDGFKRVSPRRAGYDWFDRLLYPAEQAFGPNDPVESITIAYPARDSWTSGTDTWVIYWFVASMVFAFCFMKVIKVHV